MTTASRIAGSLLVAAALGAAGTASAQDKFPSRTITMINPFTAGGPVDLTMRTMASQLEKILGQPVVVDVKPGASATLGPATMAATAKPDGYTVGNFSVGIYTLPHMQKVTFDPMKDFTYIIHLNGYRGQFAVLPDAKWKNWQEFLADARSRPGQITFGSTGAGGSPHLNMESLMIAGNFKLLHVPFRGNSEAITALLGGHINVYASSGTLIPMVEQGQVRSLLTTSEERNPRFPNTPSLKDVGIKPLIDPSNPFGMGGPKGMDPAVVKVLHDAMKQAFYSEEYQKVMKTLDLQDRYLNSADYTKFAAEQYRSFGELVRRMGMVKH